MSRSTRVIDGFNPRHAEHALASLTAATHAGAVINQKGIPMKTLQHLSEVATPVWNGKSALSRICSLLLLSSALLMMLHSFAHSL